MVRSTSKNGVCTARPGKGNVRCTSYHTCSVPGRGMETEYCMRLLRMEYMGGWFCSRTAFGAALFTDYPYRATYSSNTRYIVLRVFSTQTCAIHLTREYIQIYKSMGVAPAFRGFCACLGRMQSIYSEPCRAAPADGWLMEKQRSGSKGT